MNINSLPINTLKFYTQPKLNLQFNPAFGCQSDSFEKTKDTEEKESTQQNPKGTENIKFKIKHGEMSEDVTVTQNPLDKVRIFKKVWNVEEQRIEKVPFIADVAYSEDGAETTFYFLEPETKKEIGYFIINNLKETKKIAPVEYENFKEDGILENYKKEGIVGSRIYIVYLQNNNEDNYCGIGCAADQIAVEYCKKIGIRPNIISIAGENSHAAHYKRGRRFFPIEKNLFYDDPKKFVETFHTNDPNKVIERRIEKANDNKSVDCNDLGNLLMYMPRTVVRKYQKQINENPILH